MDLSTENLKKYRLYRWYHGKRAEHRIDKIGKDLVKELKEKYPEKYKYWDPYNPRYYDDEDSDMVKILALSIVVAPVAVVTLPIVGVVWLGDRILAAVGM